MTILVLSVAVPAAAALGLLVGFNVLEARRAHEGALLATARAVSTAIDMDLVRKLDAVDTIASSDALIAKDWARLRERAARLELGEGGGLWVTGSDKARAIIMPDQSGRGDLTAPTDIWPDSESRNASEGPARVSNLHLDPRSEVPVISVGSSPVLQQTGRAAVLTIPASGFRDVINRQPAAASALVTLVDARRRVIARSRDHELYVGASATPAMIAAMAAAPDGVVASRSLDGDRTVVAYSRSEISGWTTMVVVPRWSLEAPLWTNILGVGAVFLLLAGLSFVAVRNQSDAISHELEALEQDAAAVGRGVIVTPRPGRIASLAKVQTVLSCASAELERRDERQTLLINELNHRVKNTLATVQAVAAQTFRGAEQEALRKFDQRLVALGRAHDLLTHAVWTEVEMKDVIERCAENHEGRIRASGPSVMLPPEAALALYMCLHELTTNSLKYGALVSETGSIEVEWSRQEEGDIQFFWREEGGPLVSAPTREGFGTKLMDRLARHELNGRLEREYMPSGLVARGRFRLPPKSRFRSDM
ncbi:MULTISPECIES: sensor histidine kinase [unclassified Brevundimonas]|uniref:sensor histidine kinase n=1 Tax=unclassified Brevundimonas TaxID=2622653 RepID=UPI0025B7FCCD|nr:MULTISPECIES: sensor histidine kinase [unclassified Brevundimonas]